MSKLCGYNCVYNEGGACQLSACIKKSQVANHTEIVDEIIARSNEPSAHLIKDIEALIQENKSQKERIAYLERSNDRREDDIIELRNELCEEDEYKEKWIKIKNFLTMLLEIYEESDGEYVKSEYERGIRSAYGVVLHKMNDLDGEEI